MKSIEELIEALEQDPLVYRLSLFQPNERINRTYINLEYNGRNRQSRGEKNFKLFIDNDTGMIHQERGKGSTGWNFEDVLSEFVEKYQENCN